jgi:XRE family transcriptional regulator, aerobic/anaerobic benzoate catabolism transcriptional regulator
LACAAPARPPSAAASRAGCACRSSSSTAASSRIADLSLTELFSLHGEDYYRRLERETLQNVLAERRAIVLATGGGIVTSPETFAMLRRSATTVWLRARPEDHWNRVVRQGDRRPMADHPQAMADLRSLLASREPLYAMADHIIDTAELSADAVVRRIDRLLA